MMGSSHGGPAGSGSGLDFYNEDVVKEIMNNLQDVSVVFVSGGGSSHGSSHSKEDIPDRQSQLYWTRSSESESQLYRTRSSESLPPLQPLDVGSCEKAFCDGSELHSPIPLHRMVSSNQFDGSWMDDTTDDSECSPEVMLSRCGTCPKFFDNADAAAAAVANGTGADFPDLPSDEPMPDAQQTKRKADGNDVEICRTPSCDERTPKTRRGVHVKHRPDMQKRARDGQIHWAAKVEELRTTWYNLGLAANPYFLSQLRLLEHRRTRSQLECLLRSLHIAAAKGLIYYDPFNDMLSNSFMGWTGFVIVPNQAAEFRSHITSLLPEGFPENTLQNIFRRSGLVPDNWDAAWLGLAPFTYKSQSR